MRRKNKPNNKYPNMGDRATKSDNSHGMMLVYAGPIRRLSQEKVSDDLTMFSAVYAGPPLMESFLNVDEEPAKYETSSEGEAATTFCKTCGSKISASAKFCPECGAPCFGIENA